MPPILADLRRLEVRWKPLLQLPDWYLTVIPEIQLWTRRLQDESDDLREVAKGRLYDFFEYALMHNGIALGNGRGFDAARKPIDTIVVHHSSNPPGISPTRLSAIELIRLYGPYFSNPPAEEGRLKGMSVFSGHVRDSRQVFWPYHWMIRENGVAERLLEDTETGWHAGNWDINCRSAGIVLDGDYECRRPQRSVLDGIARVITDHYRIVPLSRIVGHLEITSATTCPSRHFLTSARATGWKDDLFAALGYRAAA